MKKTILVSAGWILAAGMIGTALPGQAVLAAKRVTSESGETSSEGKSSANAGQKAGKIEGLNYIGGKTYTLNLQYSKENSMTGEAVGETGVLAAVSRDFDYDGADEIFSVSYKDSTNSPTGRAITFSILKETDGGWKTVSEQEMLYLDYQGNYREMSGMSGGTAFSEVSVFLRRLDEQYQFFYEVKEMLTEEITLRLVKEIKRFLLEDALALSRSSDEQLMVRIKEIIDHKLVHYEITPQEREKIARRVFSSLRGLGILDELLDDDSITEIMINGPENIFVEKDGQIYRYRRQFESEQHLLDIIQRIVGEAGKEVNQANPIVDTRIQKDGSRVNVVLPPISLAGPVVTIRKFSKKPMTVEKLLEYGSITPEVADFLQKLVRAKYNIFISGGTGSGKTTFLNALSNFIPEDERIITIEDSAELQIRNISNLVSLETRNANTSGRGEITIRDLIRSALRMRPERIIVGEVRGAEALDMLQAMNTGHDGSLSTGHANSTRDMLSRLETMVLQGNAGLPLPAIRQQISSALDIVIHLSRLRDKSRRTMEITEILGCSGGEYQLNPLFVFQETQGSTLHKVQGRLMRTGNSLKNDYKLRLQGMSSQI